MIDPGNHRGMAMRLRFILLLLFAFHPAPALAQSDEIRGVISDQLAAFQANDLTTAFSYASPAIKRIFRDPQTFGQMVQNGYPMVWRPAAVRFGGLGEVGGQIIQTVYFTDQAGQLFEAAYEMIETDQGWQINGVYIRKAELGA